VLKKKIKELKKELVEWKMWEDTSRMKQEREDKKSIWSTLHHV
jgi:ribosomal protein L29